jgi:hypothetical protein
MESAKLKSSGGRKSLREEMVYTICLVLAASQAMAAPKLYSQLQGKMVYAATDLSKVDVTTTWKADEGERVVAVFFRSFG